MRRALPVLLAAALAACAPRTPSPAPPPPSAARDDDVVAALTRLREAFQAGDDLPRLLRELRAVDALTANHPVVLHHLARTHARLGDTAAALIALERLAPMGLAADPAADPAFAALRDHPAFRAAAARLAGNAAVVVRGDTALVVDGPDLLPESVAYDPADGAWYLGSLAHHGVVRVEPGGAARDFAVLAGRGRVIGIKVDAARRRLWVLETTIDSAAPRTYGGVGGWTSLRAYDLPSGREVARHAPADRETPHLFNDLAVSPAGDVYVTDLYGNAVWRLRAGGAALEPFARGPRFHWPNGIALSPDGRHLYAAHLDGISRIDPRTGRVTPLAHPPTVALADVDGLYACRGALVAVQRMADFQQVTRFPLSPTGDRITGAEALERRHPAYVDPTTGVLLGDTLVYIANSQFRRLRPDHTLAPAERPSGTVLLRLPLGKCVSA